MVDTVVTPITRYIPDPGTKGFFELAAPFSSAPGEQLTCKAVRKISELFASGEDVFTTYYKDKVSEIVFQEDVEADSEIVFLMGDSGEFINVPSRFILKYPDMNGEPYRGMGLAIQLPAFPVKQDLSFLLPQLEALVTNALGVPNRARLVVTSRTTLMSDEKHKLETTRRRALILAGSTPAARIAALESQVRDLQTKLAAAEALLIEHL
mgnify:CR=1 FL=1